MADEDDTEKSEDPSQKRLDDALQRGDVAKSQEVNGWFVLAASALIMLSFSGSMTAGLTSMMRGLMSQAHAIPVDSGGVMRLFSMISMGTLAAVVLPLSLLALAAIAGNMVQHRLVWSTESLTPKFSKISPMAGFKRLFSKIALVNFVKGMLKLAVVGAIMAMLLWPKRNQLESMIVMDPVTALMLSKTLSMELLGAVVAVMAIVAAADFLFQYHEWYERQKMSLKELKDEYKQTEGDPAIKAKIRQLRQQRAGKRMMAAVPEASVIITNPTHYAVALKYERGMSAPICVAKGLDNIALKIREIGGKHDIPIIENPPLARALHATVEIDDEVPPEHYKAVAEVIGYVMRLKNGLRS